MPFDPLFALLFTACLIKPSALPPLSTPTKCRGVQIVVVFLIVLVASAVSIFVQPSAASYRSMVLQDPLDSAPHLHDACIRVPITEMVDRKQDGAQWNGQGNLVFPSQNSCRTVAIETGRQPVPRSLEISIDHNDLYALVFLLDGKPIGIEFVRASPTPTFGLKNVHVPVRRDAYRAVLFDTVIVQAVFGDGAYSIGHLLLRR